MLFVNLFLNQLFVFCSPSDFKTPTRIPRSRSGGVFSGESPHNDSDFQQDIIWDATSPSPNRRGKPPTASCHHEGYREFVSELHDITFSIHTVMIYSHITSIIPECLIKFLISLFCCREQTADPSVSQQRINPQQFGCVDVISFLSGVHFFSGLLVEQIQLVLTCVMFFCFRKKRKEAASWSCGHLRDRQPDRSKGQKHKTGSAKTFRSTLYICVVAAHDCVLIIDPVNSLLTLLLRCVSEARPARGYRADLTAVDRRQRHHSLHA